MLEYVWLSRAMCSIVQVVYNNRQNDVEANGRSRHKYLGGPAGHAGRALSLAKRSHVNKSDGTLICVTGCFPLSSPPKAAAAVTEVVMTTGATNPLPPPSGGKSALGNANIPRR